MKISQETMNIISNFATINQNIFIQAGNVIKTKTQSSMNVIAEATVVEEFTHDFAVYELSKLLNVLNLFDSPDIKFHEGHLSVQSNNSEASFSYSEKSLIDAVMDYSKEINAPEPVLTFSLPDNVYKSMQKSAKLFNVESINIATRVGEGVRISASDAALSKKNANRYTVDLDTDKHSEDISVNINLENLRMYPGDYDVSISIIDLTESNRGKLAICNFVNTSLTETSLKYTVAASAD